MNFFCGLVYIKLKYLQNVIDKDFIGCKNGIITCGIKNLRNRSLGFKNGVITCGIKNLKNRSLWCQS